MALSATIDRTAKTAFRAFKDVAVPVTLMAAVDGDYDPSLGRANVDRFPDEARYPDPAEGDPAFTGIVLGFSKAHNQPLECTMLFERRVMDRAVAKLKERVKAEWDDVDDVQRVMSLELFDRAEFVPDYRDSETSRQEWTVHAVSYGFGIVKILFHTTTYQGEVTL